jgi:hypothetical protein
MSIKINGKTVWGPIIRVIPPEYPLKLNLDAGDSASYPGTGNVWIDTSTHNNNAILYNASYDSDMGGGSIIFDEISTYAIIQDNSSIQFGTGDFTISMWVYPNKVTYGSAAQGTLLSKDYNGFEISFYQGNLLGCFGGSGIEYQLISNYFFTTDKWKHIVVTRNNGNISIYIDSIFDKNIVCNANISGIGTNLRIGDREVGNYKKFNGYISKILLYNNSISQSDITTMFNDERSRYGI